MVTFSELVDTLEHLSNGEMLDIKRILDERLVSIRQEEILAEIALARKQCINRKTLVLSSQEDIKEYFLKSKGVDSELLYKKDKGNIIEHFGSNPKEEDGYTFQKKVREQWD